MHLKINQLMANITTTLRELVAHLETIAPVAYQENYDNAGLIVGDFGAAISGVLVCLDVTEAVVEEAIALGCNCIVAHHPIVFKGIKKFNGRNYVERVVMKAIRHDVAIFAMHTNLDNMYFQGVNAKIAEKLGLENTRILAPKAAALKKLSVYVPASYSEQVRAALTAAGAGQMPAFEYGGFATLGVGVTLQGNQSTIKLETFLPMPLERVVLAALKASHPTPDEITYELTTLENTDISIGSGMIGTLKNPMEEPKFLEYLKKTMQTDCVRHTELLGKSVKTVAVCGGAGSFLLPQAIAQGADVFVTADFKYHEFFDAENKLIIADIGHFESEQFTIELLIEIIRKKYTTFAVHFTKINTNPVKYF